MSALSSAVKPVGEKQSGGQISGIGPIADLTNQM
jgi:hypothetical protein